VGSGLKGNHELRMLDLSENFISKMQQNLDDLELRTLNLAQNKLSSLEGWAHHGTSWHIWTPKTMGQQS
jgi:Leucine-rich repeat (LRR) protein